MEAYRRQHGFAEKACAAVRLVGCARLVTLHVTVRLNVVLMVTVMGIWVAIESACIRYVILITE